MFKVFSLGRRAMRTRCFFYYITIDNNMLLRTRTVQPPTPPITQPGAVPIVHDVAATSPRRRRSPQSIIPGVSVQLLRVHLDELRRAWCVTTTPFYFSSLLMPPQGVGVLETHIAAPVAQATRASFCMEYMMGHCVKRFETGKRQQAAK